MSRPEVLGLLAPPKGIPITSHYLSLDIVLGMIVTATSDSIRLVKGVQPARSALALHSPSARLSVGPLGSFLGGPSSETQDTTRVGGQCDGWVLRGRGLTSPEEHQALGWHFL